MSLGFLESMKPKEISTFHKKVVSFFEERKKEANYPRAITLFLISTFLLSQFLRFINLGISKADIIQVLSENYEYFISNIAPTGSATAGVLFISAAIYLLTISKALKIKINFSQILYFYGMAALVASLALILFIVYENAKSNSPASVFAVLASLLILFGTLTSLYMILVMFKVLNGISYKKTAAILIATTILTRALASTIFVFVMVMPYYMIFGVHNPPTYYYYNITTNSDGSITATYAWMLNATNKPQEICYVGFPKGWVLAEYNITSIVVLAERNRTVESYDMSDVFYKSNTGERDIEYFIFVHSPPEDWGAGLVESIAQGAKRDKETEVLFNEMFKINDFRYDTFDDRTKAVVVEMSDINRTLNRYRIVLRTAVGIGYEAVYQSPYNENNDISYILNHSKCYKYG